MYTIGRISRKICHAFRKSNSRYVYLLSSRCRSSFNSAYQACASSGFIILNRWSCFSNFTINSWGLRVLSFITMAFLFSFNDLVWWTLKKRRLGMRNWTKIWIFSFPTGQLADFRMAGCGKCKKRRNINRAVSKNIPARNCLPSSQNKGRSRGLVCGIERRFGSSLFPLVN